MKYGFVIIVFTNFSFAYAQERIWTKQTNISEVISFEKKITAEPRFLSQNESLSKAYYPLADRYHVTNPVIVQRAPLKYLPVYAEYFYTPADSILRLVSYDWEKERYGNFFAKQKMWADERTKFSIYNDEYNRIKDALLTELGIPTLADDSAKEVNTTRSRYLTRETVWENDILHADLNMIFESTTYRIRLTLYWKK
jgi:hypothetical protein